MDEHGTQFAPISHGIHYSTPISENFNVLSYPHNDITVHVINADKYYPENMYMDESLMGLDVSGIHGIYFKKL